MTREQIEKAAKETLVNEPVEIQATKVGAFQHGFIAGAQWRIKSVWHKKHAVIPDVGRLALLELIDPGSHKIVYKIDIYSGYEWKGITHYENAGLIRFAYIDDLLPERKEETE